MMGFEQILIQTDIFQGNRGLSGQGCNQIELWSGVNGAIAGEGKYAQGMFLSTYGSKGIGRLFAGFGKHNGIVGGEDLVCLTAGMEVLYGPFQIWRCVVSGD